MPNPTKPENRHVRKRRKYRAPAIQPGQPSVPGPGASPPGRPLPPGLAGTGALQPPAGQPGPRTAAGAGPDRHRRPRT
ncbi:hypothetical protein CSC71_00170 [Pseudoxanthomonas sangjuensis]|nr:hypothetical protein CSC71_00170 [Pseudoxanthomonas sangjuensis]